MALETGPYIDSLNIYNPTVSDPKSQGDDHLRLIKSTLKGTFPNINAPVTVTPAVLNAVEQRRVPLGLIGMWHGAKSSIPAGWVSCDSEGAAKPNPNNIPVPLLNSQSTKYVISPTTGAAPGATNRRVSTSAMLAQNDVVIYDIYFIICTTAS